MNQLVLILNNIRSTHNIGSLLRTADGLGVSKVYITGLSPYPMHNNDLRIPHLARKIHNAIHKTSLGAENSVDWEYCDNLDNLIAKLHEDDYEICALEQSKDSIPLKEYKPKPKIALILGNEVEGVDSQLLLQADKIIEIPMHGEKESFNVSVAGAIAAYHLLNQA